MEKMVQGESLRGKNIFALLEQYHGHCTHEKSRHSERSEEPLYFAFACSVAYGYTIYDLALTEDRSIGP